MAWDKNKTHSRITAQRLLLSPSHVVYDKLAAYGTWLLSNDGPLSISNVCLLRAATPNTSDRLGDVVPVEGGQTRIQVRRDVPDVGRDSDKAGRCVVDRRQ